MIKELEINEKTHTYIWEWKKIEFRTWKLATQTDWSIVVSLWDTVLLVTTVLNRNPNPESDFLPLTIEFKENYYAWWKIWWWQYNKREWRPSEAAILNSRLTDRPIRPMFPEWMVNDIVVTISVLSIDRENMPWVLSIIWSSLAIMLAWIPFEWPVWAVRIWYKDWEFLINPSYKDVEEWLLNLVIAWSEDTITMVECESKEIDTDIIMKAFEIWQNELKKICEQQKEFLKNINIETKEIKLNKPSEELMAYISQIITEDKLSKIFPSDKKQFNDLYEKYETEVIESSKDKIEDKTNDIFTLSKIKMWVFKTFKKYIRKRILTNWERVDWRWLDQVRPLYCEVWLFQRIHWIWLFQRWETQVMSTTTLWAPWDVEVVDSMEHDDFSKRFIHHYNMPPFSTNEARTSRWVNRREIWHWKLAEKWLTPVLPTEEEFPYTIRIVSEVLSSNWSTSMASVCASTLSLMDAWVPIKAPVSWIAMWLVTDENLNYKVLTDIQWLEDFTWDMDFKVAWTKKWINALQMDMKIKWLKLEIIKEAIQKANIWRLTILDFMLKTLETHRPDLNPHAPKIYSFKMESNQIREVIWPWWETITEIIKQTNVKIDFKDDWTCVITAKNDEWLQKCLQIIKQITWTPKIWDAVEWTITRVENYWIFVNIWKNKTWLCHVKNLWDWFIPDPRTMFKEWTKINVVVTWIDNDGKIQLKKS
jgi:polyribonucleotide nucleotidyltransferase